MSDQRWEQAQLVAQNPFGRPLSRFGQLDVWSQETTPASVISMITTFTITCLLLLSMAIGGTKAPPGIPNVKVEQIVLGDSLAALEAIGDEVSQGAASAAVASTDAPSEVTPDLKVKEFQDEFGAVPDPNASVQVDPQRAQRLRNNIKNLADGIQIASIPRPASVGAGGVPISGIFKELLKDSTSAVFVIDKSGSMSGVPLQRVAAELVYALNSLSEEQSFFVIFFDDVAWPMHARYGESALGNTTRVKLVPGTDKNKADAGNWINTMIGSGGTQPGGAMLMALDAKPQKIVLLSDGEFSAMYVDQITKRNRGEAVIDCIGLGEEIFTLKQIAAQNKGKYYQAK